MTSIAEEDRLLFLTSWKCKGLTPSNIKIQSYFNSHALDIVDQHNLKINNGFRNKTKTCPYCFYPWYVDTTSFKLLPSKKPKNSQKQKQTDESGNSCKMRHSKNSMVLKCKICLNNSLFCFLKKKVDKIIVPKKIIEVKKKRKRKDKSCGLHINLKRPADKVSDSTNTREKKRCIVEESSISKHPVSKSHSVFEQSQPFLNSSAQTLLSKKNNKKLQKLKQAIKADKGVAKKTFKDFLNLI